MHLSYIVGIDFRLPGGANRVTAEWLTKVLRKSGGIAEDGEVGSIQTERFSGGGLICSSYKICVSYKRGKGPARLFMKMPLDVPKQRALVEEFDVYRKEALWYRDVAPNCQVHVPRVYAAMVNEQRNDYCLLMDDVSHLEQRDRAKGLCFDDAMRVVDMLATYHSHWTDSSQLSELRDVFVGYDHPTYVNGLQGMHDGGWANAKTYVPDLAPQAVAFGDAWKTYFPLLVRHMTQAPLTLSHGDPKLENLFFDDARDRVVIVDPQLAGVTNVAQDLAIVVGFSMEPDQYRGRVDEVVRRYVDASGRNGVWLDRRKMMTDLRLALGMVFYYGFASFGSYPDFPDSMKRATASYMRRIGAAIAEFDVLGHVRNL